MDISLESRLALPPLMKGPGVVHKSLQRKGAHVLIYPPLSNIPPFKRPHLLENVLKKIRDGLGAVLNVVFIATTSSSNSSTYEAIYGTGLF